EGFRKAAGWCPHVDQWSLMEALEIAFGSRMQAVAEAMMAPTLDDLAGIRPSAYTGAEDDEENPDF
ncbi:hypothetical protein LGQ03_16520, partial [Loktanella sp. TSTF-M6]